MHYDNNLVMRISNLTQFILYPYEHQGGLQNVITFTRISLGYKVLSFRVIALKLRIPDVSDRVFEIGSQELGNLLAS